MVTRDNLFLKIEKGENEDIKQFLLENSLDIKDEYGRSPIINATFYNNHGLIEWIIENGADKDFQDNLGYTALHFAAQEAHLESAKILLDKNANPNVKDSYGNTPSWVAVMNWKGGKNFDLLKELINHNADLSIKNNAGKTTQEIIPDAIMDKLKS